MESLAYIKEAYSDLKTAEYILDKTYGFTGDTKLLMSVAKHVLDSLCHIADYLSAENGVSELKDNDIRLSVLLDSKYVFENELKETVSLIFEISKRHKESPVEFTRDGNIVICSNEYDCIKIGERDVIRFVACNTMILEKIGRVII